MFAQQTRVVKLVSGRVHEEHKCLRPEYFTYVSTLGCPSDRVT